MSVGPLDYESPVTAPPPRACGQCGGPTVRGNLLRREGVRFVPDFVRNLLNADAGAPVTAFACRDCGAVALAIEPQALRELARLSGPGDFWYECGSAVGKIKRWFGTPTKGPDRP